MNTVVQPAMRAQDVYNTHKSEFDYYDRLHSQKYRDKDQTKLDHIKKMSFNLSSDQDHEIAIGSMLYYNRFIPAGRIQAATGAIEREVSPFNCSVSQKVEDNIDSIYDAVKAAAKILRLGTGIGYNFSHLRPKGALVKKLQTQASGPLSYMEVFETSAATIASAGHRRGAQMGILNIDHPDIEEFIDAKLIPGRFRHFNLSVGVTDSFMAAVEAGQEWPLSFRGQVYKTVSAKGLWNKIITNAYNSAEPGVIFIDKLNYKNNLYYIEHMEATNPCAEQPLPPYGLCTLGSFNYAGYVTQLPFGDYGFNFSAFKRDIWAAVEAYDNIFDKAIYAIPEHKYEALSKRRMGLGATGIASAIELIIGRPSFGDADYCEFMEKLSKELCYEAYRASVSLAKERGAFPLFDRDKYLAGQFIKTLPDDIQQGIYDYGIRNSHLVSYAPCGTISQCAGNVSSGIEPIFFHEVARDVHMKDGQEKVILKDFNYRQYGFKGKTLEDCTVEDHIKTASIAQEFCDSAVSKTVNVAPDCSYADYESIYMSAYKNGSKGMTVFRPTEMRGAVIVKADPGQSGSCKDGVCTL